MVVVGEGERVMEEIEERVREVFDKIAPIIINIRNATCMY